MTAVTYGDKTIDVEKTDIPRLIAALAVAADPINPRRTLDSAKDIMPEFDLEREALYLVAGPLKYPV